MNVLEEHDLARLFKALGDETRLKVLKLLSERELSVGELSEELELSIARVSHHLGILRSLSLVTDRRQGKQIIYALAGLEDLAFQGGFGWVKGGKDILGLVNQLLWPTPPPPPKKGTLSVFAASSFLYAFEAIGRQFQQHTGIEVSFRYGPSGELGRLIEQGASADVFASASPGTIETLHAQGELRNGSLLPFAKTKLALWQREGHKLRIESLEDLLDPQVRWLVIANPNQAPSGAIASALLKRAGVWEQLSSKLLLSNDAAQTRVFADTDNGGVSLAPLTVTASAQGRNTLLPEFRAYPLEYYLALTAKASPLAEEFVSFLLDGPGNVLLRQYGFSH